MKDKMKKVFGWVLSASLLIVGLIVALSIISSPSIWSVLLVIFLGALIVGLIWYMFFWRRKIEESSKYDTIITLSILLSGLIGIAIFLGSMSIPTTTSLCIPISGLWSWVVREFGLLLLLMAFLLFLTGRDYKSAKNTEKDYHRLEGYLRELEDDKDKIMFVDMLKKEIRRLW